jgi:hypothetical protein
VSFVFKHEALLTFVGRLVRDREFSEWFAARPRGALASHGLTERDVRDVADVLAVERSRRAQARALQPTVATMLKLIDEGESSDDPVAAADRFARLDSELHAARTRLEEVRRSARPWWKFW